MAAPSQSTPRGARIAAIVLLGVFAFFALVQGSSSTTSTVATVGSAAPIDTDDPETIAPTGTPPAADVTALLNGLSLGNDFDGWRVLNFTPTNDKILWVEFGKDRVFFSVGIGAKGQGNPPPPIQTERYEVGYGMVRPKGGTIPQDVLTKITEQIASRIRMREAEVAKPTAL